MVTASHKTLLIALIGMSLLVWTATAAYAGQYYIRKNTESGQTLPPAGNSQKNTPGKTTKTPGCADKEAKTLKEFQGTINLMYDRRAGQKAISARQRIEKFYSDPKNIPYLSDLYTRCGHVLSPPPAPAPAPGR